MAVDISKQMLLDICDEDEEGCDEVDMIVVIGLCIVFFVVVLSVVQIINLQVG